MGCQVENVFFPSNGVVSPNKINKVFFLIKILRLYFHKRNPPTQYWGYISLTVLKEHLLYKNCKKWDFIVFLSSSSSF